MLGFVLNTHQQWLCRQLGDAGYEVSRQVSVPDTGLAIQQSVRESLARADFLIVTGGLGPTSDDITRDLIAALLGKRLRLDKSILARLEAFFAERGRVLPLNAKVQAMVPTGALVLENPNGTAPGLAMHVTPNPFRENGGASWLVMLPGPPREMRPMFTNHVLPLLRKEFPLEASFACRTLRTTGMGESLVEEAIAGPLKALVADGLKIGYCAHSGHVDVRVAALGERAATIIAEAETIVRGKLENYIFGTQHELLNGVVVRLLTERKQSLVLAESCTGGYVANQITDVSGASAAFRCGLVTYSNESKQDLLGVSTEILARHGAVSRQTAAAMATGARVRFQADYALAITGIAGPAGGSAKKPVGTVFIALATAKRVFVIKRTNRYDRATFKHITCQQALELLRRELVGIPLVTKV